MKERDGIQTKARELVPDPMEELAANQALIDVAFPAWDHSTTEGREVSWFITKAAARRPTNLSKV